MSGEPIGQVSIRRRPQCYDLIVPSRCADGTDVGVSQSVVSAYESGARQPSLPTLERLVRATGCELAISVRSSNRATTIGTSPAHAAFRHREEVKGTAARHGLSNVRVFGSVARGDHNAASGVASSALRDARPL
jgi:hypothetical protein